MESKIQEDNNTNLSPGKEKELISSWISKLSKGMAKMTILVDNNNIILNHKYLGDNKTYKIIETDLFRTKCEERKDYPNFHDDMKKLLFFFCEANDMPYKQGMNEILAIFYFLKIKNDNIELFEVFNIFSLFLDFFFTNYYYCEELYALHSSLALVDLLLRYHEPEIFNQFNNSNLNSQIYATNLILTIGANKNSLDVTYKLWEFLIEERDQAMVYFIIVAILQFYKNDYIHLGPEHLLSFGSKIKIHSLEDLEEIIKISKKIKASTPYSLYILMNSLEIFEPHSPNLELKYEQIKPQKLPAFPFFPSELIFEVFKVLSCPDILCKNFSNCYGETSWESSKTCCLCKEKANNVNFKNKDLNLCLLDLRIPSKKRNLDKQGILPNMHIFENNVNKPQDIQEKLINVVSQQDDEYHYVFLTNFTNNFEEIENLYKYEITDIEELKVKIGLSMSKGEKTIEKKELELYLNKQKDKNEANDEVYEYDILKKLLDELIIEKHKYISFVYGGYYDVHQLCLFLNIPLISHNVEKCRLCEEIKLKKKNKKYEIIKKELFEKSFNKNDSSHYKALLYNEVILLVLTKDNIIVLKKSKEDYKKLYDIPLYSIIALSKEKQNDNENIISILFSNNVTISDVEDIQIMFYSKEDIELFYKSYYTQKCK